MLSELNVFTTEVGLIEFSALKLFLSSIRFLHQIQSYAIDVDLSIVNCKDVVIHFSLSDICSGYIGRQICEYECYVQ